MKEKSEVKYSMNINDMMEKDSILYVSNLVSLCGIDKHNDIEQPCAPIIDMKKLTSEVRKALDNKVLSSVEATPEVVEHLLDVFNQDDTWEHTLFRRRLQDYQRYGVDIYNMYTYADIIEMVMEDDMSIDISWLQELMNPYVPQGDYWAVCTEEKLQQLKEDIMEKLIDTDVKDIHYGWLWDVKEYVEGTIKFLQEWCPKEPWDPRVPGSPMGSPMKKENESKANDTVIIDEESWWKEI